LVGAVVFAGCDRRKAGEGHPHEPGAAEAHAHDGESKAIQFTLYGERHEVFAEYSPAVVGKATRFVVHVTDVETYKPLTQGTLKFTARLDSATPVAQGEATNARIGIFLPEITFPKAGKWTAALTIPGENGEATIALPSIEVFATAHDAAHAEVPPAPEGIALLKEQQWKIGLGTGKVARRTLIERVSVPAVTQPKPGFSAVVTAPISGQVVDPPDGRIPIPGTVVQAGQVIALLKPVFSESGTQVVEVEAEFARAKAGLQQAEQVFDRVKKLRLADAKSQRELQEAELALADARARHDAAVGLRSFYGGGNPDSSGVGRSGPPLVEVRAPMGGIVDAASTGLGGLAQAGERLFTLLNTEVLWVEASIPELHVGRLTQTKGAAYSLPTTPDRFIDILTAGGKVIHLGRQVDETTRTVPLVYEVPNSEGRLLAGQAVTLQVETTQARDALAIPVAAVIDEAGRPVAFVQVAGEVFERRDLVLGIKDAGWVQVLGGLEEGERVVTQAAFAVRLASMSNALPSHGHAH
jgi:hypothetical protein